MLHPVSWRGVTTWLLLLAALFSLVPVVGAQETVEDDPVLQLIAQLPTEAKVGQLVMVSFPSNQLEDASAIVTLVDDYAVGGVLLRPENGNLLPTMGASAVLSLTNQLQSTAWQRISVTEPPLPLFIGVETNVAGLPITSFISDTTPLPTSMALGATWARALSEATGQVMGRELSAMGVNFVLGPDLDVLATPRGEDPASLGTAVFGSSPYWVGELGQAYLRGLHQGSDDKLTVIPRYFPGVGSIDRPLTEEVPTVQRSLEQLRSTDMQPFYTVLDGTPGAVSVADGLLIPHVRYSGLQGSVRASSRPLSLDVQALQLALEPVAEWQAAGGLLVADNLGQRSLRLFDDPEGRTFNARRMARDALLAGNDLLIMDRFAVEESWEAHFTNVRDTLDFLAQSYETDAAFRSRVDEALYHVLQAKLRLYPERTLTEVVRDRAALEEVLAEESSGNVGARVALNAITRLVPQTEDLLPSPPQAGERFVIFTQERPLSLAGAEDNPRVTLASGAVRDSLQKLYGREGTGQITSGMVQQFTFAELLATLEAPPTDDEESLNYQVRAALQAAQWIIFAVTDLSDHAVESDALVRLLEQEAGLLERRQVAVLNFGSPYGLGTTDFSKLDVYYSLYSPGETFVQAGVRALFRDLPAAGDSPVTIPALNYDISVQTEPDPNQVISLAVVKEDGQAMTDDERNSIRKDDVIHLRTSVILDRNGNPVPDGTAAEFILNYPQENRREVVEAETEDGVAFIPITLDRVGQLDISVKSGAVAPFYHLQLTIREGQSVVMISITPTPTETSDVTPTAETDAEATIEEPALPEPLRLPVPRRIYLLGWGLLGALLAGGGGVAWALRKGMGRVAALRRGAYGYLCGLCFYLLFIVIGRWLFRGWFYWLAGREILSGGVTFLGGGFILLWLILKQSIHPTDPYTDPSMP